jgi:microtubule-associated protein-like 6
LQIFNFLSSLALHPDGNIVATGQVTGLKGSKQPKICIWDSTTLQTLVTLEGFHEKSVCALDFTRPDGTYLVSVGTDFHNSVAVYDWKKNQIVAQSYGTVMLLCY